MHNQKFGQKGEKMALEYLIGKGYQLVLRNYRHARGEIDLIMQKDQLLVFVEVKARSNRYFGEPEEAVNFRKSSILLKTADCYLQDFPWEGPIRFDIVSICKNGADFEIVHLEDAIG